MLFSGEMFGPCPVGILGDWGCLHPQLPEVEEGVEGDGGVSKCTKTEQS